MEQRRASDRQNHKVDHYFTVEVREDSVAYTRYGREIIETNCSIPLEDCR